MVSEVMTLTPGEGVRISVMEMCCHHWIIESPNGANSRGVCKHCGAHRDFINFVDIKRDWRKRRTPVLV